jgi:hypothetical protein
MKMIGKNGQKKKKLGDEDETPIRVKVREFVEGKFVTATMTCITLFALFGDDFRLWFLPKAIDLYFYGALGISMALFALEVLLNCCVQDDFKYSFFFWLDIVATLSLIVDIKPLMSAIEGLLGMTSTSQTNDVTPGEIASSSGNTA